MYGERILPIFIGRGAPFYAGARYGGPRCPFFPPSFAGFLRSVNVAGSALGLLTELGVAMASSPISQETEKRIALLFPPGERALVRAILSEQCGHNLPFVEHGDDVRLERFQFAALKLSEGKLNKLDCAVALCKRDWRDLLLAAGFAEGANAHLSWLPEQT